MLNQIQPLFLVWMVKRTIFVDMKMIEQNIQKIIELCRLHRVKTLSVFGSILTEWFNEDSDIGLLVSFDSTDHEKWDYVGNFFDFQDALETLLAEGSIWLSMMDWKTGSLLIMWILPNNWFMDKEYVLKHLQDVLDAVFVDVVNVAAISPR